tara:strand:+ start:4979 stop:6757 length:1779 start_codon:yes stop_codon:yes gene_type:complete
MKSPDQLANKLDLSQLTNLFIDQSKELYWIVNLDFELIYKNNSYISFVNEITNKKKKLHKPLFMEGFDKERSEKWNAYFKKAFLGESLIIEEYFTHPVTGKNKVFRIHIEPLKNDSNSVFAIVCRSRDITEIVNEKERLKLFENVIINTNDAVLITEAEPLDEPGPKIVYVNAAFTKMTGYEAYEVIGKTPRILQGPNSDKAALAELGKAIRNWQSYEITTINYKKNGEEFWINFSCTPVANEKGWYTHWIAIERDVTEEKKLKELNLQVSRLAKIGSWEVDLIHQTVYWSEEVHQIHETDSKAYIPNLEEGINFYREDFRDLVKTNVENTIATGSSWDFEAVIVTVKKKELWIRAIGDAEFKDGKCIRIYGGFQDIHNQKIAALKLEKSLKKIKDYKFALDQSAITGITDKMGVITYVNDKFCEISGYSRDELMGQTHQILNSHHHSPVFFKNLWETIASGNVWRAEIKNKAKDDSYYWVDTTIIPFLDKNNEPKKYLSIRFDITKRKRVNEEKNNLLKTLESSNAKLKKIAWTQSHEVRAPLSRMLGIIDLIDNNEDLDDMSYWLKQLKTSTLEMDEITKKIVHKTHELE